MSDPITFDVYRPYDPALMKHNEPSVMAKYAVGRDVSILEMPPPEEDKPIRFRCRSLSRDQRRRVRELTRPEQQYLLAFRYGIISIENLPGGKSIAAERANKFDGLSDDQLDAMMVGDVDIEDVGSVVFHKSFLALGVPPSFPLLDSSQRACGATLLHLAELETAPETATAD